MFGRTSQIARRALFLNCGKRALLSKIRQLSDSGVHWTKEKLDEVIKGNKIVVFMKGVPEQPMCGFSNAVVQILRMHGVDGYSSYNVLEDDELRQQIKDYSQWPTVPQVYIGGEFVGGCDIMMQLHREGELIEEFEKVGLKSALCDQESIERDKEDK